MTLNNHQVDNLQKEVFDGFEVFFKAHAVQLFNVKDAARVTTICARLADVIQGHINSSSNSGIAEPQAHLEKMLTIANLGVQFFNPVETLTHYNSEAFRERSGSQPQFTWKRITIPDEDVERPVPTGRYADSPVVAELDLTKDLHIPFSRKADTSARFTVPIDEEVTIRASDGTPFEPFTIPFRPYMPTWFLRYLVSARTGLEYSQIGFELPEDQPKHFKKAFQREQLVTHLARLEYISNGTHQNSAAVKKVRLHVDRSLQPIRVTKLTGLIVDVRDLSQLDNNLDSASLVVKQNPTHPFDRKMHSGLVVLKYNPFDGSKDNHERHWVTVGTREQLQAALVEGKCKRIQLGYDMWTAAFQARSVWKPLENYEARTLVLTKEIAVLKRHWDAANPPKFGHGDERWTTLFAKDRRELLTRVTTFLEDFQKLLKDFEPHIAEFMVNMRGESSRDRRVPFPWLDFPTRLSFVCKSVHQYLSLIRAVKSEFWLFHSQNPVTQNRAISNFYNSLGFDTNFYPRKIPDDVYKPKEFFSSTSEARRILCRSKLGSVYSERLEMVRRAYQSPDSMMPWLDENQRLMTEFDTKAMRAAFYKGRRRVRFLTSESDGYGEDLLRKEFSEMRQNPPANISAGLRTEGDFFHWSATIVGPQGSPYENGHFVLHIDFPPEYPRKPPTIKCVTDIFHPSFIKHETAMWSDEQCAKIGSDLTRNSAKIWGGRVCAEFLSSGQWLSNITVAQQLQQIRSMLADYRSSWRGNQPMWMKLPGLPKWAYHKCFEKYMLFIKNKREFDRKAKEWTEKYAMPKEVRLADDI